MAPLQGRIHAIGGLDPRGNVTNAHYAYDPLEDAWSTLAPMPTPRRIAAVAAVGGNLYVFGGFDASSGAPLGTNEMYDPASNRWKSRAPMHTARGMAAGTSVGGKIYAVGGRVSKGTTVANEVYDPVSDRWSARSQLTAGRCGIAAVGLGETLFLCGGAGDDEEGLDKVEAYEPAADDYATLAPVPSPAAAARWGRSTSLAGIRSVPRGKSPPTRYMTPRRAFGLLPTRSPKGKKG